MPTLKNEVKVIKIIRDAKFRSRPKTHKNGQIPHKTRISAKKGGLL